MSDNQLYYQVNVHTVEGWIDLTLNVLPSHTQRVIVSDALYALLNCYGRLNSFIVYGGDDTVNADVIEPYLRIAFEPYYALITNYVTTISITSSETTSGSSSSSAFNANELQPINASLTEISAPTSKSGGSASALVSSSRTSPELQLMKLRSDEHYRTIIYLLIKIFRTLFQETCTID